MTNDKAEEVQGSAEVTQEPKAAKEGQTAKADEVKKTETNEAPTTPREEASTKEVQTLSKEVKEETTKGATDGGQGRGKEDKDPLKVLAGLRRRLSASVGREREEKKGETTEPAGETAKVETPTNPEGKEKGIMGKIKGRKFFKGSDLDKEGTEATEKGEVEQEKNKVTGGEVTEVKKENKKEDKKSEKTEEGSGKQKETTDGKEEGVAGGFMAAINKLIGHSPTSSEEKDKDEVSKGIAAVTETEAKGSDKEDSTVKKEEPIKTEEAKTEGKATSKGGAMLEVIRKKTGTLVDQLEEMVHKDKKGEEKIKEEKEKKGESVPVEKAEEGAAKERGKKEETKKEEGKKEKTETQHPGVVDKLLDGIKAKFPDAKDKREKASGQAQSSKGADGKEETAGAGVIKEQEPVVIEEAKKATTEGEGETQGSRKGRDTSMPSSPNWKNRMSGLFSLPLTHKKGSTDEPTSSPPPPSKDKADTEDSTVQTTSSPLPIVAPPQEGKDESKREEKSDSKVESTQETKEETQPGQQPTTASVA